MRETCHAELDNDGCFGDTEVTDIMGLCRAIALDVYDEIKEWVTNDESAIISKIFPNRLTGPIFEGESPREAIEKDPLLFYWQMVWFLDDRRIATVYMLVNHLLIRGDIQRTPGGLAIASGRKILAKFN